ncbi:hypothetical protein FRC11_011526 [Ceratobasidium sp. 423]|nr:hypothetical protein FRC11_011526 [Ceratobasidium sp. 423]
MPKTKTKDHRAAHSVTVNCFCELKKYGDIPHKVSIRMHFRHMAEVECEDAARVAMDIDDDQDDETQDAEDDPQQFGGDNGTQDNGSDPGDADIHGHDIDDRSDYGPPISDPGEDFEDIDTPPQTPPRVHTPSPPRTPPPDDDEPDDDFEHITAEDYHEYDHWFGEDQHEFDELVVETLTEEEIDSIKMTAIRLFGHISERNYERIRFSFRNKVNFLSTYCTTRKLALLSGIKPKIVDCCEQVCLAYTGKYSEDTKCAKCKRPRHNEKNRPYKTFEYLPMNL